MIRKIVTCSFYFFSAKVYKQYQSRSLRRGQQSKEKSPILPLLILVDTLVMVLRVKARNSADKALRVDKMNNAIIGFGFKRVAVSFLRPKSPNQFTASWSLWICSAQVVQFHRYRYSHICITNGITTSCWQNACEPSGEQGGIRTHVSTYLSGSRGNEIRCY